MWKYVPLKLIPSLLIHTLCGHSHINDFSKAPYTDTAIDSTFVNKDIFILSKHPWDTSAILRSESQWMSF